jgi:TRAP-type mannitol/chloroaromatic compound transport system substrate-binding protein
MKSKLILMFIVAMLILALVAVSCAPKAPEEGAPTPAPEVEVIQWREQAPQPKGSVNFQRVDYLIDMIEDMSNGQIEITRFGGGEIVPNLTELDAVDEGVLDCSTASAGYFLGQLGNQMDLFSHYPGGPDAASLSYWIWEGGGQEFYNAQFDDYNIHSVAPYGFGPAELFCHSNKPITTLEDFKGLKYRTAGIWGNVLERVGASVCMLPGSELYTSIERGVIDAFEFTGPGNNYSMGFQECAKYIVVPGIHAPSTSQNFMINKDRWNELPDHIKCIIEHAAEAYAGRSIATMMKEDMIGMEQFDEYGTEMLKLSDEVQWQICDVAKEMYDEWAEEDPVWAEIYQSSWDFFESWYKYNEFCNPSITIYSPKAGEAYGD